MLVKIQGEWIVHSFLSSSQNSRSYLKQSFIKKVKSYYHYHIRDYKLSESFHARVRYVICQLFQYKCRPLSLGNVTKRTVIRRTSFYTDVFIDFIKYHLCWSFHNLLCRLADWAVASSEQGAQAEDLWRRLLLVVIKPPNRRHSTHRAQPIVWDANSKADPRM